MCISVSDTAAADPQSFLGYTKRSAVYILQRKFREAERDLDMAIQVSALVGGGKGIFKNCTVFYYSRHFDVETSNTVIWMYTLQPFTTL